MVSCVYVESEVRQHPRSLEILKRVKNTPVVEVDHYGEV